MLFETGSFLGNANRRFVKCGFKPRAIICKSDTTQFAGLWMDGMWCGRSNSLGGLASYIGGIAVNDDGFFVGAAAVVNGSSITTHWLAIGDDGSGDFDLMSWAGNATAGRVLTLPQAKTPIAALCKRDSSREAAIKVGSNPTVFMGGAAATDCIAFTSPGVVTLSAANEVNEWGSVGGLGEGIDGLFIYASSNATTVTWTGNGAAGRVIPLGLADVRAAIIAHPSTGVSSRFVTDTTGTSAAPVAASVLQANEASISGGSLVIGSVTTLNTNGLVYSATVFSRKLSGRPVAPAIKIKNSQAIHLPANGVASYIDCGTSDATLLINGAISYEFCGAVYFNPTATPISDGIVIARGNGPYGNANGYSWSLLAGGPNDGPLGWSNAMWAPQTMNILALAAPLDASNWRTGVLIPFGQIQHVIATQDANGDCYLYVNGKLVKQRRLVTGTIASTAGHPTVIGARKSSGSYVRNTRMLLKETALYSRALSVDEVSARYARAMLGSTAVADVTTGRAAWWHADNAGGALLPDAVNAANNGTITAGTIITL